MHIFENKFVKKVTLCAYILRVSLYECICAQAHSVSLQSDKNGLASII